MSVEESEQTIRSIIAVDHWQPIRFNNIDYWSLTVEQFDYPHKESGVSKYVGPCIDYERIDEKGDVKFESWLENTITSATHKRLIYASLGSLVHDKTWIDRIVAAAMTRMDWRWLVVTGSETATTQFSNRLSNMHITPSVPQLRVLNYADVMLAGAGIASIHECISTSTPMVAYSLGVLDQNGNAARVHYHGIGQTSRAGQDSVEVIVDRINDLSSNKKYAQQMAVLKACIEEYDDQQILENEVEKTLNGTTIHG